MRIARPSDIVRLVHDRRDELGLTQQQVAEQAGVTRQLVARIENGVGDPSLGALFRVLDALGIELHGTPRGTATPAQDHASIRLTVPVPRLDASRLISQVNGSRSWQTGKGWAEHALDPGARQTADTDPGTTHDRTEE